MCEFSVMRYAVVFWVITGTKQEAFFIVSIDLLTSGLGKEQSGRKVDQQLGNIKQTHELRIKLGSERAGRIPCPKCGELCKTHDFGQHT